MENKSVTIWISGLPCSGKTTTAISLENKLKESGFNKIILLDGDEFRKIFNPELGFSKKDREENIKNVVKTSKLLNSLGFIVIASFVTPYQSMHEYAEKQLDKLFKVYLETSIDTCKERDVKGMYKKALAGKIEKFTGVSGLYEKPNNSDIVVNNSFRKIGDTTEEIFQSFVGWLEEK